MAYFITSEITEEEDDKGDNPENTDSDGTASQSTVKDEYGRFMNENNSCLFTSCPLFIFLWPLEMWLLLKREP